MEERSKISAASPDPPSSLSFVFRVIALIRATTVIDLARGTRRRRWLRLDTAAGENYEAFTSTVSRSDGGGGYAAESASRPFPRPCPTARTIAQMKLWLFLPARLGSFARFSDIAYPSLIPLLLLHPSASSFGIIRG